MATRKIHFFTGKGGVGKSTLAAAYAQHLARASTAKVLLAELTERSFYNHFFSSAKNEKNEDSLKFDLAQWSPDACLREYALHLLKIESLYKLFFQNPVSRSLIQVAPGLQELAILGKATSSPRKHGPPTVHDEIVIDSFASGHFMNLLRAPKAMSEIISFGPMSEQSRSINQWIKNPDFSHVHIVTTAEDYAVTETLELARTIQIEFGLRPQVYLNKTTGLKTPMENHPDLAVLSDLILREQQARHEISNSGFTLIETPIETSDNNLTLINNLSGAVHV